MRRALAFAVLVAGLAAATAPAQDAAAIELKLRKDTPGDKTKITRSGQDAMVINFSVMGMDNEKKENKGKKFVYVEEILARPAAARVATKFTRTYETAEKTTEGKAKKLGFEGKKVLFEKKGKKFTFTADGEPLSDEDAEDFEKELNKEEDADISNEDFLPGKPVKVGETWVIDTKKIIKSFEATAPMTLDPEKSTVKGKLAKAYDKGGKKFGVIELDLTLVVTAIKQPGMELAMKAGSKIIVKVTLDVCVDGSSQDGGETSKTTFDLKAEIPNGSLTIAGETTSKTAAVQDAKK